MTQQSRSNSARRASVPQAMPPQTTAAADLTTAADSALPGHESETPIHNQDDIRRRAYELYLERNGNGGDADGDWFAAEREFQAREEPHSRMRTV